MEMLFGEKVVHEWNGDCHLPILWLLVRRDEYDFEYLVLYLDAKANPSIFSP